MCNEGKICATPGTSHEDLQMGSHYLSLTEEKKKAMKSTSHKFQMTDSHGRWPSIRNRIAIPDDFPDISDLRTEISRTHQPKGITLCGITAFRCSASPHVYAVVTGTVYLAVIKSQRKEKLKGDDK